MVLQYIFLPSFFPGLALLLPHSVQGETQDGECSQSQLFPWCSCHLFLFTGINPHSSLQPCGAPHRRQSALNVFNIHASRLLGLVLPALNRSSANLPQSHGFLQDPWLSVTRAFSRLSASWLSIHLSASLQLLQYALPLLLPNVCTISFMIHDIWNLVVVLNRTGNPVFRLCQPEVFHINTENVFSISNTKKFNNIEETFKPTPCMKQWHSSGLLTVNRPLL